MIVDGHADVSGTLKASKFASYIDGNYYVNPADGTSALLKGNILTEGSVGIEQVSWGEVK